MTSKAYFDRREGTLAVLRLAKGQEVSWPLELLDPHLSPGDVVVIGVYQDTPTTTENTTLAKQILNDILEGSH
jgi:hypothetical protein